MDISRASCPNCDKQMAVTQVICSTCSIQIQGSFELPHLAQLTEEDQNFVIAFIQFHGSIKQTGEYLGISYPTVKNRLTAIAAQLPSVTDNLSDNTSTHSSAILSRLDDGTISVQEAIERLEQ